MSDRWFPLDPTPESLAPLPPSRSARRLCTSPSASTWWLRC
ncbi:hypothetical protein [Naasia aerilata]|nr:hypothetical protein [Naasia aerilata]